MCEKDICKHLDDVFNAFLSKLPSDLAETIRPRIYFAGGCIYCLCNDKEVKDYDMFMTDDELTPVLKGLNIWSYTSEYALTHGKFQLVTKYFGEPDECVGQFDFKHNMHYYIPFSGKISCAYGIGIEEFDDFEYLRTDELIFNEGRARDLEGVYLRIDKFVKRGFKISRETRRKIKKKTSPKAVREYKKKRSSGNRSFY